MSAMQSLIQQKQPTLEASTQEHADKLLAIYFTMDKYLIHDYCHTHTGMTSGENLMHLSPKVNDRFKGKRVRGTGRLDKNGKEIKEYCQTGFFINAAGTQTRAKGDSSFPPITHIYSSQMLAHRLKKIEEALTKLTPKQFNWVKVRYLAWPESIKSICDQHGINYEVIRKPLFRAKALVSSSISS